MPKTLQHHRPKPDKYLPENQIWHKIDNFKTCEKQVLKCPECGHPGHFSQHLNQLKSVGNILRVENYIHHSHFIADLDKGRHVRCNIGYELVPSDDDRIKKTYRLSKIREIPQWIKDELGY